MNGIERSLMEKELAPRVSFVVPAFNEPPHILEESLRSVMAQDHADFECIVVDESQDPQSIAMCIALCESDARFRRVVPQERIGLAASLNLGIQEARGEFIARFDSDDVCAPDRLSRQLAAFDADPAIDILGGGLELIDRAGKTLAVREYPADHARIVSRMRTTTAIAHPTALMRRKSVLAVGGYDVSFRFSEDLDLWLRLINRGARFGNIPGIVVRYRQQSTRRSSEHWRANLRARKKNFAVRSGLRNILGIGAISLWVHTPPPIQDVVFKALVLRRARSLPALDSAK